jgi:hypothetical protein
MALSEEFEKQGNWLFRHRSYPDKAKQPFRLCSDGISYNVFSVIPGAKIPEKPHPPFR